MGAGCAALGGAVFRTLAGPGSFGNAALAAGAMIGGLVGSNVGALST